ncbi:MAG TPA: TMEM165/GDT1 family protein [Streptosporangiaceae bacterium]
MNFAVAATTLAVVLPAELPDKSALASLMLGSRYRPSYVFAGVAAAFAVHVVLALVAGGLLALLPHRALVGGLAIVGGRGLLRLVPIRLITLAGAAAMAVLAVISLVSAIRG